MSGEYHFQPLALLPGAAELDYPPTDESSLMAILDPFVESIGSGMIELRFPDGTALLYGAPPLADGFLVSSVSSEMAWIYLGRVAVQGSMFVFVPGMGLLVPGERSLSVFAEFSEGIEVRVFESEDDLQRRIYGQ